MVVHVANDITNKRTHDKVNAGTQFQFEDTSHHVIPDKVSTTTGTYKKTNGLIRTHIL